MSYKSVGNNNDITNNDQCRANELFLIGKGGNNEDVLPLNILNVQIEQQKELRKVNSKISAYILDRVSGYSEQDLRIIEIIFYDRNIYLMQTLGRYVIDWYHLYLKHPVVSRLAKKSERCATGKSLLHK